MNAPVALAQLQAARVEFTLDGRNVSAFDGETILSVAKREGIAVPHLCFKEGMRPDGNCRACVVEVAGERTLAPSCCRTVQPKMVVQTGSEARLVEEHLDEALILRVLGLDALEHDVALEALDTVGAAEQHVGHSTGGQVLEHAVPTQTLTHRRLIV